MKIDHIAIYCNDLELVKAFFIHYFDASSGSMYHNPKTGLKTYMLTLPGGGCRVELMTRAEVPAAERNLYRQGYVHLALSVGSCEAVDALSWRLRADGYEIISGPRTTGDGYYETAFFGPEQLMIEITA